MCAVRGAECVVDIDFSKRSKLLRKRGVVLFFFLVEADVFQQFDFAVFQRSGNALGAVADDVLRHLDFLAERLGEVGGNRSKRIFHVELALRTAEMRAEDHFCFVVDQGSGWFSALH